MGRPLPPGIARTDKPSKEDVIILGMPGPWAEDNCEASDHYTTKIGGLPDWPMAAEEINRDLLKCGVCGGDLGLVAQVYAPLETDRLQIEERSLFVFGCPLANCGISPLSWRTIRVQKDTPYAESSQLGVVNGRSMLEASSSSNPSSTSIPSPDRATGEEQQQNFDMDEWWEDDMWRPETDGEDGDDYGTLDMQELGRALQEAGYMAAHHPENQNGGAAHHSENQNGGAAHHPENQNGGSHSIDGEVNIIESGIPQINSPAVLPCFYIYSQNESHPSRGSRAVLALHASVDFEERHNYGYEDVGEEDWKGEEYEHGRALNADRTYLKFKKRLDCYPEQCFRYCHGGQPLLANKDQGDPGVCPLCGGPRVYEMQLMPPLLYYLQQACKDSPSIYSANNWEWLTLFVYTCEQSCSGATRNNNGEKEWLVVEEATIIQYET